MFKRNSAVVVCYQDPRSEKWSKPRIAVVKSYRASDNTLNVYFALYKRCSVFSDVRISADEVLEVLDITGGEQDALMRDLPQQDDPDCFFVKRQRAADAKYPRLAALRKDYGPREDPMDIIARIQRDRALAA